MTGHVWILNHYAQEPTGAGGTRHFSLARHLPAHGWTASIIAASVEINTGRQRLQSGESFRLDEYAEVPFLWVRTPEHQGNGGGRLINMVSYSMRALLPKVTRPLARPDVVVGSSVHPLAAWTGAQLARRHRVPFVFEVRDLWPQTLIDLGKLKPRGLTARAMRGLELWLYRRASRIVTLLPHAARYMVPLGIPESKIVWIPNGVELDDFPQPPAATDGETFSLMYFGAHGQANGLDCVLRAMAILQRRPEAARIRLRLVGDGPRKAPLQRLAEELQLNNVAFEPPVAKDQIAGLAAQANAFVFNLVDAEVFRYGISSNKLFDFLAAARPVIFCCRSSNNPVEEAGAGISVQPGDPEALAAAIVSLAEMPLEQRQALGRSGRQYVEKYHGYRALAQKFASMLDQLRVTS